MNYCIRLQTNAFFFGDYGTNEPIPTLNPLHFRSYTARYDNRYWRKNGNHIISYTNRYNPEEKGNIVEWHYAEALDSIADFVHMGFGGFIPLGSIRWNNNSFVFTNTQRQVIIHGGLQSDGKDYISIMHKAVYSIKDNKLLAKSSSYCTYEAYDPWKLLPHCYETKIYDGER